MAVDPCLHAVGSDPGGGFSLGNARRSQKLSHSAASSSGSYAAVVSARSVFRKAVDFTAAMAFEMASTNMVLQLQHHMLVFLGWQFTLAEFVGEPIMVAFCLAIFKNGWQRDATDVAGRGTPR